jgi:metal-sulfur cluster biosynthetic enzyme
MKFFRKLWPKKDSSALRELLRPIQDPELGFSIVDLGLVRDIQHDTARQTVRIVMTLTTPFCPLQDQLKKAISEALIGQPGISSVEIDLTFTPPWSAQQATKELQQQFALLGIPLTR